MSKCDLKCPPVHQRFFCCQKCVISRKHFLTEENKSFWSENEGFWSRESGCKLPEEKRPKECVEYDCKDDQYPAIVRWSEVGWTVESCEALMKRVGVEKIVIIIRKDEHPECYFLGNKRVKV